MDYGLHIIKYPTGKYGFVGNVPSELAYIHIDGSKPTPSEFEDIRLDPRIACKMYGIVTLVFDTENDALFTAARAGFQVIRDKVTQ